MFGQWLSGMARLSMASGDTELRDKAGRLLTGWAETVLRETPGRTPITPVLPSSGTRSARTIRVKGFGYGK